MSLSKYDNATDCVLILLSGLPGSGKSTLAQQLKDAYELIGLKCARYETDRFFEGADGYKFRPELLGEAHTWNRKCVTAGMKNRLDVVIVANTFSQRWERDDYINMARNHNYRLIQKDLFDADLSDVELAARCKHGVPVETIAKMRARWECIE